VNPARWQQLKSVFDQALQLDPSQRPGYIDEVCALDPELRKEIESMLAAHEQVREEFLNTPAAGLDAFQDLSGADPSVGKHIGPYQLVRELGSGGMGEVYLAVRADAEFHKEVAVKLIRSGQDSAAVVSRFKIERQILASLDHPNIAKLLDGGRTLQGQPYFVMEYVSGVPITDYCDEKKLKIRERLDLFIQVCEGVQYAHQNAIIHRDLKPANILVAEVDGKPIPRIIDFGLAKATTPTLPEHTQLTRFGHLMGTPDYMSPEQADPRGRNIDTRTDVYSLGVVLYVLLTGLLPFATKRHENPPLDEFLRRLREEEPPRASAKVSADRDSSAVSALARGVEPQQLVKLLRGDLDWITMKALERDRDRRYGSPSDLAADLRRYLNHEPVVARPASAAYQIGKFVRRHRFAAGFIGMVTVLSAVASAAALVAFHQKHEAQFQEIQALQAQSRLLTQAAAQRLKDTDSAGAQGIILEVLTNPRFASVRTPAANSVFQDIRAADVQLEVLSGHGDSVLSAAYSPDGSRIVTASIDKTARIWDAHTGVQLAVLSGHGEEVSCAAYSPDGTRIITAAADKTARIWDASTGAQLAVLSGHKEGLSCAAYSPDGSRIVTASNDKTARIWDARTGVQLAVLSGHGDSVFNAAYSPDGTHIVTASGDKTARIWDARNGAQLAVLSGHGDGLNGAAYSPDGTRIVTASRDKTARIWDARTGAQLAVLSGHSGLVLSAAYSPDGTHIVTGSGDKTARIWDAQTGAQLAALSGHGGFVISAVYSPDGTRVVTGSRDKTARIWDARMGAQRAVLSGHDSHVYSAAYSPDGTRIVTASIDKTARIWDARTGAQLAVLSSHGDVLYSAAYSPDGARIVTASFDKTACIWDARNATQLIILSGHQGRVLDAAYSPDGTRIVTASFDKTARIWDARTGTQLTVLSGHGDSIGSAAYSPDGARIVTASNDQTARIWDARSGAQLAVLSGHDDSVISAAFSPDGTRIVTASRDKTARVWSVRTGAQIAVLSGHNDLVVSAAYSPDGARIVTASRDRTARIWDARTGEQLAVLSGHADYLHSAAYSPDGTRIVTASFDKTARIWDAHVPADLAAQIIWAASAVTDPLLDGDRKQLGLPPDSRPKMAWSNEASDCDRAAASIYDPERRAPGVLPENVAVDVAGSACSAETAKSEHAARADYEMGRTLIAKGDANGARRQFERAMTRHYRAAGIDLADLLVDASIGKPDLGRAVSLYEQAWADGVSIAAFRLGRLFEFGVQSSDAAAGAFNADPSKAWAWFQQGADSGEPNALARFAERDEINALAQPDPVKRNAQLIQAFELYAAAAESAREEDWPDGAWKYWRYRRATLARLLANAGMMQQAADTYSAMLDRSAHPPSMWWERVASRVHW
jgi:WD40 repeat protein/tetratricopeptide (TPR) repeat protein